jgi:4-amino-4-deoxy-L-arabinose transferase-like glycosyltransferase
MLGDMRRHLGWRERHLVDAPVPILLVLAVAALTRTWHLSQNGFGRQYYAAGVRSMSESWHNFLYNAFDPGGFLSIDKPPVAIWLQVASVKFLGFSGISVLLPQVLAGLISILLLYLLVQRAFGRAAAGWAALALALTPISVAVDRSNNTDSCLIAVLMVAAALGMRAAQTGRLVWLCAAMAAVGIGFNVKMGAALVVAPVLALTFSLAWRSAPPVWHLRQQVIAGMVLVVVSLSWAVLFDLTPAASRPYAGSTKRNSMLELALLHNGLSRFLHPSAAQTDSGALPRISDSAPIEIAASSAPRPELTDVSPTGPLRLFRPRQAAQAAWLLPLALAGLALAWQRGASACFLPPQRSIAAGIWTGWLIGYWVVLSFAGGPVHTYYTAILAPPLAVFTGVALSELLSLWKSARFRLWGLLTALAAAAAWQTYLFTAQGGLVAGGWIGWLWLGSIVMLICGVAALWFLPARFGVAPRAGAVGVVACSLFAMPSLATASVVLIRPNTAAPVADIAVLGRTANIPHDLSRDATREAARRKLLDFLIANRGSAKYLVAVPNAVVAAPLIVATGQPVMAMGGYLGNDPILTPALLQRLVGDGEVRFVMLGGFTLAPDKQGALRHIEQWVRDNGRAVDERLWRSRAPRADRTFQVHLGNELVTLPVPELYDLSRSSGDAGLLQ